ncbi:rho GTPase-activating protein 24 isoform X4 [Silurus meridionalis]|nr:rho GTPase-activating protein 24 isoform X4 [Silurus meridionalis]
MTSNHETYLLMASTQNDMEDWVKTIRRVIWAPFGGGIFGQKLEETVRYERRYGNKLAPMLVEQCVDFIRRWGLQEEGLFRLPGQANLVKELQEAFDCGEKPAFDGNTDVHTVASLLKLYLRELPEPVIPFCKYDELLACTKLYSKDQEAGIKELRRQVEGLPLVNYNLLKYICRFLDEVQSYSGVNKMSVQNLATVFGPNILRPKVEDPVAIMEGAVLVQQLMAALIGQHATLFPLDEDSSGALESCNNNNDPLKRSTTGQLQNKENNNTAGARQCTWEAPDSPGRVSLDNGSPRSGSPRNVPTGPRFEVTRSPPLTVKKNPAFVKGSGIVTNGSFSSSSSSSAEEKSPTLVGTGTLPMRRTGALKSPGTKMGVQNGGMRMGVCSMDIVNGTLNSRNGLWSPPGGVTLREFKGRDTEQQQNRLSTYDNVHVQQTPCAPGQLCTSTSCEDKQSVDSATWSTSSCEISLPDVSASCRSSTTTCPEQEFTFEDPLLEEGERRNANANANANGGAQQTPCAQGQLCTSTSCEDKQSVDSATWSTSSCEISLPDVSASCRSSTTTCPEQEFTFEDPLLEEGERRNANANANANGGGRGSRGTSSSENSEAAFPVSGHHSALHSLVASLKQEMLKQKSEYEARVKSLELRNVELEAELVNLHEELEQERKKYTMVEIKLRNAERAKDDAEKRNEMLQKEMEQFFSTFGDLTADPRRPERANTIWIQ